METLWKRSSREKLSARIDRLTPNTHPKWGKMNASQMLCHLSDAMKMAIGEIEVELRKTPFRHPGIKHLIIYGPPFPKGAPTSPELLLRQSTDWNAEKADLQRLIESFAAQPQTKTLPPHPAFGKMNRSLWGALTYKHIDHHLKQFGV